jgi:hypothetical protein
LANNNVNLDLKIDPAKIINSAGKITLDDFKREFSKDFQELRKIIPDALIEAKLNETLAVVRMSSGALLSRNMVPNLCCWPFKPLIWGSSGMETRPSLFRSRSTKRP